MRKAMSSANSVFSVQTLTRLAMLTTIALIVFVIEAQLPPLAPIPGIKLGLSNVITLFTMFWLGRREAFLVLVMRIVLGSMFTGHLMVMIYSLSGGLLSFFIIALAFRTFSRQHVWIPSIISGIFHNIGQILCAVIVTGTPAIAAYLPVLILSGCITGLFTGLVAQFVLNHRYIR